MKKDDKYVVVFTKFFSEEAFLALKNGFEIDFEKEEIHIKDTAVFCRVTR